MRFVPGLTLLGIVCQQPGEVTYAYAFHHLLVVDFGELRSFSAIALLGLAVYSFRLPSLPRHCGQHVQELHNASIGIVDEDHSGAFQAYRELSAALLCRRRRSSSATSTT